MIRRLNSWIPLCFVVLLSWVNCPLTAGAERAEVQTDRPGKSDAQEKRFVGDKTIVISRDCGLLGCDKRCQEECEAAVGEKCESYWDVCQRCLQRHPLSPEEAKAEGIWFGGFLETCPWCRKKYPEVFAESRCTFSSSEHAQSAMGAPAPKDVSCYITCR